MTARHLIPILDSTADALDWLRARHVAALTVDSRAVEGLKSHAAVAFIAWPGAARDGRAYVLQALADGAVACLVEADGVDAHVAAWQAVGVIDRVVAVRGLKARSAEIAHGFYGEPSAALDVVAVTGTNGKTSVSWWTAQALNALGCPTGVVGTLGVGQIGKAGEQGVVSTGLTTPDPITLHATFRRFVDQGVKAAAIEASSIGIEELRLHATHIRVAQFTNFTQDHLDYHGSMAAYWQAKRELFDWPGLQAAVIHQDDAMGPGLIAHAQQRGLDVWAYGRRPARAVAALEAASPLRLEAREVRHEGRGVRFALTERSASGAQVLSQVQVAAPVIGDFNVANLLAVIGALRALGHPLDQVAAACAGLQGVPGRMQLVDLPVAPEQAAALPLAVVDYAHTPDALDKVLCTLRPVAEARGGRLWCVFGCGGDRDAGKRPLMGALAMRLADRVVLTSDNPRSESPAFILSQILAGIPGHDEVDVMEDRHLAIDHALTQAKAHDVVLIAGKGHEATQEVAGVKTPFSDVDEARAALLARLAAIDSHPSGGAL
jgi:UDP-N-acetylmuramyl-tripeptide synthetase